MRLSDEQIKEFKQWAIKAKHRLKLDDDYILITATRAIDLIDTIETLQQANENLRAQAKTYETMLSNAICNMGANIVTEHQNPPEEIEALQQENEQLRLKVVRMSEALKTILREFDEYGNRRDGRRAWMALNMAKAALTDTAAEYHNPADVKALKMAQRYLTKMENGTRCIFTASEVLEAINKALGDTP